MRKFTYYLLSFCTLCSILLFSCGEEEFETINYYTVDFEVLGDGGYSVESQQIKEAETVVRPANFVQEGYSFDGWYTEKECTTYWDFDNQVFFDMSLYAQWIANTYNVSFSSNGEIISVQDSDYNTAVERPEDPTYTGYTFDNWYGDSAFNTVWDFASVIISDTTLYANWNINSYKVSFSSNGEVISTQTKEYNTEADKPEPPTLTGYTFDDWYGDSEFNTVWDFATAITSDTTIYANWLTNAYKVSFISNGEVISTQNTEYNTATKEPEQPTLTGYTFDAWYVDSAFQTEWKFTNLITGDTTLYANWLTNAYKVSFSSNGEVIDTQNTEYNTATKEPEDPTRTGYTFDTWYGDSEFQTKWNFDNLITQDTTIYANWDINSYTVSFSSNGEVISTQTKEYNTAAEKPENPTRTGYTFDDWYSDSEFNTEWNFSNLITQDTTIYANWDINSYTVSFSSNGEIISTQSEDYNTAASEPTDPKREGFTFGGWYTDATYQTEWEFTNLITGTTTLYARWYTNPVVTFNSNEGSEVESQTLTYNTAAETPDAPTRTDYNFVGWYKDSGLTEKWDFATTITSNTTLYAKWVSTSSNIEDLGVDTGW